MTDYLTLTFKGCLFSQTRARADLARFYRQGEASVTVFTLEDVSRLHEELQQQREQLQAIVNGLARENLELRERVKTVEKKIDELKRAFEGLEKHT